MCSLRVCVCVCVCVCVFARERVLAHLHFWQNERFFVVVFFVFLMYYCSNTGVERIPQGESAHNVDPGEKNSPAAPAELQPLSYPLSPTYIC